MVAADCVPVFTAVRRERVDSRPSAPWSVTCRVRFGIFGALQLAFSTKVLRDLCECAAKAEAAFGTQVAATLRARLADLRAAETVVDVIAGKPADVPEEPGVMSLSLGGPIRLVFRSNHNRTPEIAGRVDWSRVTRIQLLRIESIR